MAWTDYGSRAEKLDYFGNLMVGGRRRIERNIKEGRNENGRNERNEMPKYTDLDCRERQSLV